MRITEVSYGRTINMGNFENVRVDMKASVDEGEDAHIVIAKLAAEVAAYYPTKGGK